MYFSDVIQLLTHMRSAQYHMRLHHSSSHRMKFQLYTDIPYMGTIITRTLAYWQFDVGAVRSRNNDNAIYILCARLFRRVKPSVGSNVE